jgi:excisionase family DNA binding protein
MTISPPVTAASNRPAKEYPRAMSEPLLTTRQVAEQLNLSPATVLRRWRSGELPGYRLASNCLRFNPVELAQWLETRRLEDDPAREA